MSRTIKQVTHDLNPVIASIGDLSHELNELIPELFEKLEPATAKVQEHVTTTVSALQTLNEYIRYVVIYLAEVDKEADQEGVTKHY